MSDPTPKIGTTPARAPDMEVSGGCLACSGDVTVRFTGRRATGLCRKCGFVSHSLVHQHEGHVFFEQLVRGAA